MAANPRRSDLTAGEVIRSHRNRWNRSREPWSQRHAAAWAKGEEPLVLLITAWAEYADAYYERYGSSVADDGVLGTDGWLPIGEGLLTLLNGELGSFDGGSLDALIRDLLENEGVED